MTFATRRRIVGGSLALALPTAALAAGPAFDGLNIPTDFADAPTVVTQRFQTQFGDNAGNRFTFGSELNQMFIMNDASFLYIGVTGNLENNGNAGLVFIDTINDDTSADPNGPAVRTRVGGTTPVAGFPRYLVGNAGLGGDPGIDGLRFDAGFFPEHVMGWTGGSPRGSRTRSYYLVNWTTIVHDDAAAAGNVNVVAGMMTDGDPTAAGPAGTLGSFLSDTNPGILGASSNVNGAGVSGGTDNVDDPNSLLPQPDTATSGFEFGIPLSLMGVEACDTVNVLAMVGGTTGFFSNQMLPPPATESDYANIGFPPFSLGVIAAGNQFVSYTIGLAGDVSPNGGIDLDDLLIVLGNFGSTNATKAQGDTDGDADVDLDDLLVILGTFGQSCPQA